MYVSWGFGQMPLQRPIYRAGCRSQCQSSPVVGIRTAYYFPPPALCGPCLPRVGLPLELQLQPDYLPPPQKSRLRCSVCLLQYHRSSCLLQNNTYTSYGLYEPALLASVEKNRERLCVVKGG